MAICGMNVISAKSAIMMNINLKIPCKIVSIDSLEILEATKRLIPRGGVQKPMAKFTTMMIPKCTGSTPMLAATGINMGASTNIAGVVSMKQPTTRSRMLMRIRSIILLSVILKIPCVIVSGTCCTVIILINADAQPKITIVVAVVDTDVDTDRMKLLKVSSRCKKAPHMKA